MRLRKKWWARPEMEKLDFFITNPYDYKGKWNDEFKNNNEIQLELGCGRGKFIIEKAIENPNINYIAIDIKDEVLIYVTKKVEEQELSNIRVVPLNIMQIDGVFDKDEIKKIYINFCNPWPKASHNKRRLTHSKFLKMYKNFIINGSEIWFKTDDKDLFEDSLVYFKEEGFNLDFVTYDLHNTDFKDNIETEYEAKFSALGMKINFLKATLK
ncbi:MAG: tRNA (guanosine(46)-N7)-methyltransferase TrmB [Clostridiaceae bacterium]